jgi:hypothetical protein
MFACAADRSEQTMRAAIHDVADGGDQPNRRLGPRDQSALAGIGIDCVDNVVDNVAPTVVFGAITRALAVSDHFNLAD